MHTVRKTNTSSQGSQHQCQDFGRTNSSAKWP